MAHPQDTTTLARLDKTRTKVLCGHRLYNGKFCDGRIASVELVPSLVPPEPVRLVRCLFFGEGWIAEEGVWQESKNAHRRRQRGYAAKYRRGHRLVQEGGEDGGFVRFDLDSPFVKRFPPAYPAYATCPHCNRIQILDATELRVEPIADPALHELALSWLS